MEIGGNHRKDYIVSTAIDLIHEKGFQHVSTKEIAKRLHISEGLVFKIFPRKNDILLAVLDHFSVFDNDIFHTAMEQYEDAIEGILFILNKFLMYYENYPAITAVYQAYDTFKAEPELKRRADEIYFKRLNFYLRMIDKAKEAGRVDSSVSTDTIAATLLSIILGMCLCWRMQDFSFSLRERTVTAITLLFDSIVK